MTCDPALILSPVLDTAAADPLRTALRRAIGRSDPLLLDGGAVERIGQACLQVLAAGRKAAAEAGLDFRIDHASTTLAETAALAGLGNLLTA